MTVHDDLRAVLREEFSRVQPPDLDVAALLEELEHGAGTGPGGRRAWVGGGVVAVVAALGLLVAWAVLSGPDPTGDPVGPADRATTAESLDVGHAPWIPHCLDGRLVSGSGDEYELPCTGLVHRGGATLAVSDDGVRLLRPDGTALLLADDLPSAWVPAISSDGRFAAWTVVPASGTGWRQELHVFDLWSGLRLRNVPIPSGVVWTPGFDARGRVYVAEFQPPYRRWVVDLRSGPATEVRGHSTDGGAVTFLTPDGFANGLQDWSMDDVRRSVSQVGAVAADGRYVPGRDVAAGWATWSPDWSRLLHETRRGWVSQPMDDPSRAVRLQLPVEGRATVLPVWESDNMVLVVFDPEGTFESINADPEQGFGVPADRTWILRCSAITGHCESALPPGNAGDLTGSLYR